jgi:hypothetical protein
MKIFTVGSDPEFFIRDKQGRPYPATPFAAGTKEKPVLIKELGSGFYEQRDNISFEGNIPPCTTKDEFINNVTRLRNYFESKVSKFGFTISPNGVEYFPARMLQSAEAGEFGCSNVVSSWQSRYGQTVNIPTPVLTGLKYRVAGFHIHLGYNSSYPTHIYETCDHRLLIGRLFDLFLTIPSHKIKNEPERILTYGKYGMIRYKTYGVECRTLSSFFTQPEWLPWVWDQLMKMESFINFCNPVQRDIITRKSYLTFDYNINSAFRDIFKNFDDKNVLTKFEETKDFVNDKKTKSTKKHSPTTVNNSSDENYDGTYTSF